MKIINDIISARDAVKQFRNKGNSIGLVPTMGALHDGHLSLVDASVQENDVTIATIFVNPRQFNNPADLSNYPVSIEDDLRLLKDKECDLVFVPSVEVMYEIEPVLSISLGYLEETMEGKYRPGHFQGVALVVLKLLNILSPTIAYFGQKDLQQFKIIERMVQDISLDVQLKMMPVIREHSGLAMSSRNRRLSEHGKRIAAEVYYALKLVTETLEKNRSISIKDTLKIALDHFGNHPEIQIEYLELVKLEDLLPVKSLSDSDDLALCFAGYIEDIRLIDNIIIKAVR